MLDLVVEGGVVGVDGGNIVRVSSDSTCTKNLPKQPCVDDERVEARSAQVRSPSNQT